MQEDLPEKPKVPKPTLSMYLPNEGLQGEDIPSNITWENAEIESIQVTFAKPLKIREVFNAGFSKIKENELVAGNIEVNGYFGLNFETSKIEEVEANLPVQYHLSLKNGENIHCEKSIYLFRPKLEVKVKKSTILVDHKTGFVSGRLSMKNVGRGLLLVRIKTTENSESQIQTPPEYREFAEKFNSDLTKELTDLGENFPSFKPYLDYMVKCEDNDYLEMSPDEKGAFRNYLEGIGNLFASDRNLLLSFVEALARTINKNNQFQDAIRKVIAVYQSLVSKDILLLNPLDEIILGQKVNKLLMEVQITDNIYDTYKNIELPPIEVQGQPQARIPIYRLVEWG